MNQKYWINVKLLTAELHKMCLFWKYRPDQIGQCCSDVEFQCCYNIEF